MTTSGLLSSRGDLLSPEPSARAHPSPRPTADQRPPPSARKPPARRTPEDPRVPGPEHLCPLSTDTRAQSNRKSPARLQARAPRPRRGPAWGQWSAFCKFASQESEPSLPYISAGRAPPARPRRGVACSQPLAAPAFHSHSAADDCGRGGRTREGPEPGTARLVHSQAERRRPGSVFWAGRHREGRGYANETSLPHGLATEGPPTPARLHPAPGKFPPRAGLPQTQNPRCGVGEFLAAAVLWGSHPPELPAPVGMLRPLTRGPQGQQRHWKVYVYSPSGFPPDS